MHLHTAHALQAGLSGDVTAGPHQIKFYSPLRIESEEDFDIARKITGQDIANDAIKAVAGFRGDGAVISIVCAVGEGASIQDALPRGSVLRAEP